MKNRKQPLFKSFGYAFEGIWTGISKERNMKIHCLAVILVASALKCTVDGSASCAKKMF